MIDLYAAGTSNGMRARIALEECGLSYTIADFSLYAGYARAKGMVPEVVEPMPNLERWAKDIGARPGVQRALKF